MRKEGSREWYRAEFRVANRNIPIPESGTLEALASRVLEYFEEPNMKIPMTDAARNLYNGFLACFNAQVALARSTGQMSKAARLGTGPWHLAILSASKLVFEIAEGKHREKPEFARRTLPVEEHHVMRGYDQVLFSHGLVEIFCSQTDLALASSQVSQRRAVDLTAATQRLAHAAQAGWVPSQFGNFSFTQADPMVQEEELESAAEGIGSARPAPGRGIAEAAEEGVQATAAFHKENWPIERLHAFLEQTQYAAAQTDYAGMEAARQKELLDGIPVAIREVHGLPIDTADLAVVRANAANAGEAIAKAVQETLAAWRDDMPPAPAAASRLVPSAVLATPTPAGSASQVTRTSVLVGAGRVLKPGDGDLPPMTEGYGEHGASVQDAIHGDVVASDRALMARTLLRGEPVVYGFKVVDATSVKKRRTDGRTGYTKTCLKLKHWMDVMEAGLGQHRVARYNDGAECADLNCPKT